MRRLFLADWQLEAAVFSSPHDITHMSVEVHLDLSSLPDMFSVI